MSYLTHFARFWYDFIVGDSVLLAIGGVATFLVAALLVRGDWPTAAEIVLPAMVIATLVISLRPERPPHA